MSSIDYTDDTARDADMTFVASESDSSVQVSTNRGQKLKRKAHHVQEGRLNSCRKQKRVSVPHGY